MTITSGKNKTNRPENYEKLGYKIKKEDKNYKLSFGTFIDFL